MAGLCDGGNEPPGSLKATSAVASADVVGTHCSRKDDDDDDDDDDDGDDDDDDDDELLLGCHRKSKYPEKSPVLPGPLVCPTQIKNNSGLLDRELNPDSLAYKPDPNTH
ncbi:hypothetical protein ANN_21942 [Periplaneta americana]|uniref:Uncharacterized protein n=1 Tax=Periplaneta americana TaxID=6978 RepID=A0ABQ8S710_PERAM|nr:hypothetical protein ANN_21942 [Periplaneta americana]